MTDLGDEFLQQHASISILKRKLDDYTTQQQHGSSWQSFSQQWNAANFTDAHLINVMFDEFQHDMWRRTATNSASDAVTSPNSTPQLGAKRALLSSSEQARTQSSLRFSGKVPGESSLNWYQRIQREERESRQDGGMGASRGGSVSGSSSVSASPNKLTVLKRVTENSRMFRTVVPTDVDIVIGSEECTGKYGPWMKLWVKAKNTDVLNNFGPVIDGMPWLNFGDDNFKLYKGAWMPTPITMEMFCEGIVAICERNNLIYKEDLVTFNPTCISTLVVQKHSAIFKLTGPIKFLKPMYAWEFSSIFNSSIQYYEDGSMECDEQAKEEFIRLAKRINIPVNDTT